MMGIGTASGDTRAVDAAQQAISSPLLESSIDGATRVLLSIAGSKDLGIQEISDAADVVANAVDPEANIIFGTVVDESLGDQVRITVIATGFSDSNVNRQDELFAAQQSQSKVAASAEPQRTAPAASRLRLPRLATSVVPSCPTLATTSLSFPTSSSAAASSSFFQRPARGVSIWMHPVLFLVCKRKPPISLRSLYVWSLPLRVSF